MKEIRKTFIFSLLTALVFCSSGVAATETTPSGKVSIDLSALESGVGGTLAWERGVLTFKGKNYPFKVKGLTLQNLESPNMSEEGSLYDLGEVFDLKDVQDFSGTYKEMQPGVAAKISDSGLVLKNQRGVIMNLKPDQEGILLTPAAEGVSVQIE